MQVLRKVIHAKMNHEHTITSPSCSYTSLPYDIRVIVHSYLGSGQLFAPKLDCPGLYWSCKQAQEELDHIVHDQLKKLCTKIQDESCGLIVIQRDPDDLRHIKVVLPFNAFDHVIGGQLILRRDTLTALHPLLAFHFDTLHISLSCQNSPEECIPSCRTLMDRVSFHTDSLRSLLRDMGSFIDLLNKPGSEAGSTDADKDILDAIVLDNKPGDCEPFPRGKIRVQRICLSWDFRKSPSQDTDLSGRLIYGERSHSAVARKIMQQLTKAKRSIQKTSSDPIFDPPYHQTSMVYYLRGDDHDVGENGIVSLTRWRLDDRGGSPVQNLVGLFKAGIYQGDKTKALAIKSGGLGMKIRLGSASEEKKTYSEEAETLHREYMQKLHDAMFWAYQEEGIFMD
jgi:hypothetical protein